MAVLPPETEKLLTALLPAFFITLTWIPIESKPL